MRSGRSGGTLVPMYFDAAATAPMRPEALAAYAAAAEVVGNASSLHGYGRAARALVEDARECVAADLGAHPSEVVFTSGGTEANNWAVKGLYWAAAAGERVRRRRHRIIASAIEHASVLEPANWLARTCGAERTLIPVDGDGVARLEELRPDADTAFVTLMLANNEVGTIEPVAVAAEVAHAAGVPLHTDAISAVGQIPVRFGELGADTLSVAAHKVGGPLGVGALLVRRGTPLEPLLHGGGQEQGRHAGTLDMPGIAGFAAALRAAASSLMESATMVADLRDQLVRGVLATVPGARLIGPDPCAEPGARLPGNALFVYPGADPDALFYALDSAGVAASVGAACAAGVATASHVLLACGVPAADARAALRFSLATTTAPREVEQLLTLLPGAVASARAI